MLMFLLWCGNVFAFFGGAVMFLYGCFRVFGCVFLRWPCFCLFQGCTGDASVVKVTFLR